MLSLLQHLRARLRERHTVRAHFWQSLANYTQQGFGLVFGVVLARLLTPADFGAYGLAVATVFLAILPAMWSLAPALLADSNRTPQLFGIAASFAWTIAAARLAICALVVIWFFASGQAVTAWLCIVIGITESFRELNNVPKAILEGAGRFEPNFISVVANILFCIFVILPLAFLDLGPYLLTLPGFGMIISDFFIYRYFSGRNILIRPRWTIPREYFHSGFWLWLNSIAEVGLIRFDKWFVGRFRGEEVLGFYNRAFGYAPLAYLALSSFATNPTVSGLARCETPQARLKLFLRTAAILIVGGVLNWFLFFFFAREIVLWVFGPKWEGTIPIFRAFASLTLAYAVAYLPITVMYAQRRYREVAIVRATIVLAFGLILIIFHKNLSAVLVAWLLQATFVFQGIILLFFIRSAFRPLSIVPSRA